MKHFGKQLEQILHKTGMFQKDLARQIGYTNVTLSKWKKKPKTIKCLELEEISKVLGVSITYWFDDDVAPTKNTSITKGHGSAASVYDDATNRTIAEKDKEIAFLKELLAEKEITIQILIEKKKLCSILKN